MSDSVTKPVATCYLLDVGMHRGGHSGSSNILLLNNSTTRKWPNARISDCNAIRSGCGDQSRTTLRLLRKYNINKILHILITHNDEDHCGGLLDVLNAFKFRVGTVWFLQDRPGPRINFYPELKRLLRDESAIEDVQLSAREEQNAEDSLFIVRIEATNKSKHCRDRSQTSLDLRHPLYAEDSMDPQVAEDKNSASAILYVYCGEGAILFPGDAQIETLRRARDHFSASSRIRCDVLAVPHHGGMISPSRCTESRLNEFYSSTLSIGFAVVSVASENRDRHPFPEHIGALASQTSHVMCTQITNQCHDNTSSLGESVLVADCETPQASERAGEANGVGCAGSVVVHLDGGRIEPRRWKEHQAAVTALGGKPLCRCSQT